MPPSLASQSSILPSEKEFASTGRRSFSYFLSSKAAFAQPTLTHQFQVQWPWPVLTKATSDTAGQSSTVDASPPVPAPAPAVKREKEDEDGGTDGIGRGSPPALEVTQRRYGRPTTILSLSADPHAPTDTHGEPWFDPHHTPRVALLLSPGYRFRLPLLPVDKDGDDVVAGAEGSSRPRRYWRVAQKTSYSTAATARLTSVESELVIGELSSLEWAMQSWHCRLSNLSRSAHPSAAHTSASPFSGRINLAVVPSAAAGDAEGTTGAAAPELRVDRSSVPFDSTVTAAESAAPLLPFWSRPTPRPSQLPVHSLMMHSVPYKVLWLHAVAERLLVCLPCEERIITVHTPFSRSLSRRSHHENSRVGSHRSRGATGAQTAPGHTPGQCEPVPMRVGDSFQLPRGVVPLDVAEVPQRPFVAVGTYEHGVLLCWLNVATGALEGIAQSVSLCGIKSALFPVTRVAPVFAPLWSFPQTLNWPRRCGLYRAPSGSDHQDAAPKLVASLSTLPSGFAGEDNPAQASTLPKFPWTTRACFLASLRDGALVCSSPYDNQTVVVKNLASSAASASVFESFGADREDDPLLSVSSCLDNDVGVLAITTQGRLVRLQAFRDGPSHSRARTAERPLKRRRAPPSEGEAPSCASEAAAAADDSGVKGDDDGDGDGDGRGSSDGAGPTATQRPGRGVDTNVDELADLGRQLVVRHAKPSPSLIAERLAPVLMRAVMTVSRPVRLHRLGDCAPIFELKPTKHNRLDGPTVQHFMVASTTANELVLLDRTVSVYKYVCVVKLKVVPGGLGASTADGGSSNGPPPTAASIKTPTTSVKEEPEDDVGALPTRGGPDERVDLDDLCSGAALLTAGHQWLTAVAAHHGNIISVFTFAGEKKLLGMGKQLYSYPKN